jgi:hypothetical protein
MKESNVFQMFNTASGRDDANVDIIPSFKNQTNDINPTGDVENPSHYNQGCSPYEVARTMYGAKGLLTFVTINSIKYIQRYPHKFKGSPDKQLDDLIKAKRSLETAIELHQEIYGAKHIRHG